MVEFSDITVYVDESGDHGLENIDNNYPIFVLAFIIVERSDYINLITPSFQKIKFDFWGHDQIVFHEREIRKKEGPFSILTSPGINSAFMEALNDTIEKAAFRVCVASIDKAKLKTRYAQPWNPYEIALRFCMERLLDCLQFHNQHNKLVHVIFESRGRKEDETLELEFRRISTNQAVWGYRIPDFTYSQFEPIFARKYANATGLQLADLIARPCGLRMLRPDQPNKAYEIIFRKIWGQSKEFP